MTRIAAADNLTIDYTPERWRLSLNGEFQERVVAEAAPGRPLRYIPGFADRRRLPPEALDREQIKQVVLGWSGSDQAWHLGLLLMPDLAEQRGSRWCEIARWQDPAATEYAAAAEHAGRALADALNRTFRLIPPQVQRESAPARLALPALPLKVGIWTLNREGDGETLALTRHSRWLIARLLRIGWYGLWMVVYVVLSVATLTVKLALPNSGTLLPNPAVLPLLGLATGLILFVLILKNLLDILVQPGRIVLDPVNRTIAAYTGSTRRWMFRADQLQAVYVSQVMGKRRNRRVVYHGEINLQLDERQFHPVIVQENEEERLERSATGEKALHQDVLPLEVAGIDTDMQAAGLHIARALGDLPCWYDQRVQ